MSHDRRGPATASEGVPRDDDAAALSRIQQVISRVVPAAWTASMEAESRTWMVRCRSYGFERSIWELGGIRARPAHLTTTGAVIRRVESVGSPGLRRHESQPDQQCHP
jgi:hypothetical protein